MNPLERKEQLKKEFQEKKKTMGEPKDWSKFIAESGVRWEFGEPKAYNVWEMEYLGEPYQPSEEEQNALSAAEEWLRVPEILISARQMRFIADKHHTTIKEMREALNILRRYRVED